jgi:hypothetical protein
MHGHTMILYRPQVGLSNNLLCPAYPLSTDTMSRGSHQRRLYAPSCLDLTLMILICYGFYRLEPPRAFQEP